MHNRCKKGEERGGGDKGPLSFSAASRLLKGLHGNRARVPMRFPKQENRAPPQLGLRHLERKSTGDPTQSLEEILIKKLNKETGGRYAAGRKKKWGKKQWKIFKALARDERTGKKSADW